MKLHLHKPTSKELEYWVKAIFSAFKLPMLYYLQQHKSTQPLPQKARDYASEQCDGQQKVSKFKQGGHSATELSVQSPSFDRLCSP